MFESRAGYQSLAGEPNDGILLVNTYAANMCYEKQGFDSYKGSRNAAARRLEVHGVRMRSYRCPFCGKWHLTSSEKEGDGVCMASRKAMFRGADEARKCAKQGQFLRVPALRQVALDYGQAEGARPDLQYTNASVAQLVEHLILNQ